MPWPRFRYSLRSLLLGALLSGSIMLLWQTHDPWVVNVWDLGDHVPTWNRELTFSRNGNVLLVRKDLYGDSVCNANALDSRTGKFLEGPTLFTSVRFSPATRYVIIDHRNEPKPQITLFDTVSMKSAGDFTLYNSLSGYTLSPDDRFIYFAGGREYPSEKAVEAIVEATEIATGKSLWAWSIGEDLAYLQIAWHDAEKGLLKVKKVDALQKKVFSIDINRKVLPAQGSECILNAETGAFIGYLEGFSPENYEHYTQSAENYRRQQERDRLYAQKRLDRVRNNQLQGSADDDLRDPCRSPDGLWQIDIAPKGDELIITDLIRNEERTRLKGAANLRGVAAISEDKRFIAACSGDHQVAIWRRKNTGNYHLLPFHYRWQLWLAVVLFLAFLFSLFRDFKPRKP